MDTPESRALRHVFAAERAAGKIAGPARRHAAARDPQGRRDRRRHHGRRHHHELPQRRHPRGAAGDEAGSAGPGPGHHPQELRELGEEGQAHDRAGRAAHGPDHAHARLRTVCRRRPGDRSGVRGHGRQGAGVPQARRSVQARRHPGLEHVLPQHRPHRRFHEAARRRAGPALLQPGQRDAAAGSGARRQDSARRAGHLHGAGQEDQEGGGGLGRVRRLHRQPHAVALRRRGPEPHQRRRAAAADRRRAAEVRPGHGTVPHGRPGRPGHRLGHAQAQGRRGRRADEADRGRQAVRGRPLRPEDRRRLVPLRSGQARPDPRPGDRAADQPSTAPPTASRRAR